jgi:hypothetical protein
MELRCGGESRGTLLRVRFTLVAGVVVAALLLVLLPELFPINLD